MDPKVIGFSDFLSEEDKEYIQKTIGKPKWEFNHTSDITRSDFIRFWIMKLNDDSFYRVKIFEKIKEITGDDLVLERVYMNGHLSCTHGQFHNDSDEENGRTFLVYCNPEWHPELGGMTCFNVDGNLQMVYPEPWSAVYFQADQFHFAMPISKTFTGLRVTLAYKMKVK